MPSKSVVIGTELDTGQPVEITEDGRKLSTYIIGIQGMSKSNLLEHIARQDIANGDGLCFIDPKGESAEKLLRYIPNHRKKDVIIWDVTDTEHPLGLNPFYRSDINDIDSVGQDFIDALENLEEFREAFKNAVRMSEVLRNLALTFALNPGHTLADAARFLGEPQYRQALYPALEPDYHQTHAFWISYDKRDYVTREHFDAALNKLRRFESNRLLRNIFGQPKTAINFRDAMDEGKIIIVKLSPQIPRPDASFIGTFIIWEIARAVFSRKNTKRQFHLIVDEFSRFMTNLFERLHAEARGFGLDVTIAHQHRGQIDDDKLKSGTLAVGNKIILRVSGRDAAELARELDFSPKQPPVVQYRPKLDLAFDPLAQLERSGHTEPSVLEAYEIVKAHLNSQRRALEEHL